MTQTVINSIAEILSKKGVRDAVISPGSRSAPLTIALARHPSIKTWLIPDERAAAFIALGIAEEQSNPVILVCTSGTAALNYSPAICEAFYQKVPLIVLTADRPHEWLDQLDGQTIHQNNLYEPHVKRSYSLPTLKTDPDDRWYIERIISESVNIAKGERGPVHINIPFREPFYPKPGEPFHFDNKVKIIEEYGGELTLEKDALLNFTDKLCAYDKILILGGQLQKENHSLDELSYKIPVISEVTSNLHASHSIKNIDAILTALDNKSELIERFCPDILITFGLSVISKNLKKIFREHRPLMHWHIQERGEVADTFQSLTEIIRTKPQTFFKEISDRICSKLNSKYRDMWQSLEDNIREKKSEFFEREREFAEFYATSLILSSLPQNSNLHLGNSMPVRYANLLGINNPSIKVFSNRGTSGIDGTLGTAVGHAIVSGRINTVILGDMSFFHGRNGLWHNYIPPNLRIVVINNRGGGIFRIIEGPRDLPECDEYFVTDQQLVCKNSADEFNLDYFPCNSIEDIRESIKLFFSEDKRAKLMEIFTDSKKDFAYFKKYLDWVRLNSFDYEYQS